MVSFEYFDEVQVQVPRKKLPSVTKTLFLLYKMNFEAFSVGFFTYFAVITAKYAVFRGVKQVEISPSGAIFVLSSLKRQYLGIFEILFPNASGGEPTVFPSR